MRRGSTTARLMTALASRTMTPRLSGSGWMAVTARSTSASAWARSWPVGWRPK
jgi:hypothetical protein